MAKGSNSIVGTTETAARKGETGWRACDAEDLAHDPEIMTIVEIKETHGVLERLKD